MSLVLIVILVVLLVGAAPVWGYSRGWGYNGVGAIAAVLLVLVILSLMGYVPRVW